MLHLYVLIYDKLLDRYVDLKNYNYIEKWTTIDVNICNKDEIN
mgnify:CR=1 FL=1